MQHKYCFEAVHCMSCEICRDLDALVGGLPAVLVGDFAQICPFSRMAIVPGLSMPVCKNQQCSHDCES